MLLKHLANVSALSLAPFAAPSLLAAQMAEPPVKPTAPDIPMPTETPNPATPPLEVPTEPEAPEVQPEKMPRTSILASELTYYPRCSATLQDR
jgi:hypothetical protein